MTSLKLTDVPADHSLSLIDRSLCVLHEELRHRPGTCLPKLSVRCIATCHVVSHAVVRQPHRTRCGTAASTCRRESANARAQSGPVPTVCSGNVPRRTHARAHTHCSGRTHCSEEPAAPSDSVPIQRLCLTAVQPAQPAHRTAARLTDCAVAHLLRWRAEAHQTTTYY